MKKIIYTLFLFPLFIFSQDLDVADGASLTIGTGGTMTIAGELNSNITGSIIIETSRTESGSLLAIEAGDNQGKGITLKRNIDQLNAGSEAEWTLIGVPVTGEISTLHKEFQLCAHLYRSNADGEEAIAKPHPKLGICHLPYDVQRPESFLSCSSVISENNLNPCSLQFSLNVYLIKNKLSPSLAFE